MDHYKEIKRKSREYMTKGCIPDCVRLLEDAIRNHPDDKRLPKKLNMIYDLIKGTSRHSLAFFSDDEDDLPVELMTNQHSETSTHLTDSDGDSASESLESAKLFVDKVAERFSPDLATRSPTDRVERSPSDLAESLPSDSDELFRSDEDEDEEDASDEEFEVREVAEDSAEAGDSDSQGEDSEGVSMAAVDYDEVFEGFRLDNALSQHLYQHQRKCLQWLFSLYSNKKGGVLCDEAGLGKTLEVIAFLQGMVDMEKISSTLIVMPPALIAHWKAEFHHWASKRLQIFDYYSGSEKERRMALLKAVRTRGCVLLTTYGLLDNRLSDLSMIEWDYLILDEAQQVKNPLTDRHQNVKTIGAGRRLILTQTDVRNDMSELWSYLDVAQPSLLPEYKRFIAKMAISTANDKHGKEKLEALIKPHILRRTKADVDMNEVGHKLNVRKQEVIVWTSLSDAQQKLYKNYLKSKGVRKALGGGRPLVPINALKRICNHPRLLEKYSALKARRKPKMMGNAQKSADQDGGTGKKIDKAENSKSSEHLKDMKSESLMMESGKLQVTIDLVKHLRKHDHQTVVLSSSQGILNALENIMQDLAIPCGRIDGTISANKRYKIAGQFQSSGEDAPDVILLSVKAALGLTLTRADRIIVYDPNWKSATDAKAINSVFRIGQNRDVVVYHLVTCGTVEEKIYAGIHTKGRDESKTKTNSLDRRFGDNQLVDLFSFDSSSRSETYEVLKQLNYDRATVDDQTEKKYVEGIDLVVGMTCHHDSSLFAKAPLRSEE